jgi:oligopeptide transport system substrate-binding protein
MPAAVFPVTRPARRLADAFGPFGRLFLLALAFLLAGCTPKTPEAADGVLRLSQRNEPGDLDPALATLPDEFFIIRALAEGLVTPAPDGGAPLPAAATRWEVSADGLTYTFHLRPGATWSNGDPVTAADFIASYRRVLSPATGAPKAALFFLVRGAEEFYRGQSADFSTVGFHAADARTLVVTLQRPAPQFLAHVASGPWIPVHPATVAQHGRHWTRPGNFVGNGPFTLTEWRPNQRIVVTRRADYWDRAAVKLAAIHFLAFDNGDAEERAFRAGQVDVTMAVPTAKIAGYAEENPSRLRRVPLHETRYLAFNTTRPPLDDPRVRLALSLALDRTALVDRVLQGGPTIARHYVPDGLGGFRSATALQENTAQARQLLAAAGYPDGRDFPDLELTGWSQTPVLEAIQAMWQSQLGIRSVRLAVREAKVHLAALQAGDYALGFMTAIPDVADAGGLLDDFRTGAPGNYAQWREPAFDALLDRAADATTPAARLAPPRHGRGASHRRQPRGPALFQHEDLPHPASRAGLAGGRAVDPVL